jgi:Spy/CpxP family protein refolding chaperone
MKFMVRSLAVVAAAALGMAITAWADSPQTKPALPSGYVYILGVGSETYEEFFKVAELTSDQQEKVRVIEDSRQKACKDKESARTAALAAMRKAYADNGSVAIEKTTQQYIEASKAVGKYAVKAQADILAALTPRQKTKWQEYMTLKLVKSGYHDVAFTDPQWEKIMDAFDKLAKDSTLNPQQVYQKLLVRINDILTMEQKAKRLLATRYAQMAKICQFTDEQVKKIVQIEDERAKAFAELRANSTDNYALTLKAQQEATDTGDSEAMGEIVKHNTELTKAPSDLNRKYDDQVQALLTDKQKAAWMNANKDSDANKPATKENHP